MCVFFEGHDAPEILEGYRWLGDLGRVIEWIVPKEALSNWASEPAFGANSLFGATVDRVGAGDLAAALFAIVGWVVIAAVLFERRRNLT